MGTYPLKTLKKIIYWLLPMLEKSMVRRTGAPGENSSGSRLAIPDEVLAGFEPRSSDSLAFVLTTRPPRPGSTLFYIRVNRAPFSRATSTGFGWSPVMECDMSRRPRCSPSAPGMPDVNSIRYSFIKFSPSTGDKASTKACCLILKAQPRGRGNVDC